MPIINSKTGKVRKYYSSPALKKLANYMRAVNLTSLNCAGSGHSGGTLSVMDLAAVLYLKVAKHDPKDPFWPDRDRIIWSAGHKAPALYTALGISGYFPIEDIAKLRKYDSPYQGHPHWLKLPGVEASTGSLGQGLGIAVGIALAAKLNKKKHKVFCITGDGEWDEGSMWESTMAAAHHKLNNLIVLLDRNFLQIDGWTRDVMKLDPLEKRLASFGFSVFAIDGHNIDQILKTFEKAKKIKGKPVVIVAYTVKGKGVSFMENVASWHGKAPNHSELEKALKELKLWGKIDLDKYRKIASDYQKKIDKRINKLVPQFSQDYFWNKQNNMKADMKPTRHGFGDALAAKGGNKRVVCLGLDISDSVTIAKFYKGFKDREDRFLSMGIAEQSGTTVAAGLAKEGKLAVLSTYGVFCSQRNADQMRTTVCYGNFNVLFGGAHGGISVGPDGATHQSLEEISVVGILPNMRLAIPCDLIETQKAVEHLLIKVKGPKYVRFAREATPIITDNKTPFVFGLANVIRFRKEADKFKNAFEIKLAKKYKSEGEKATIIACGPLVAEAMRAAWILDKEKGIKAIVLNIHTIKPLDKEAIRKAAAETKIIVTAEEHQKGGFGNLVAAAIMEANLAEVPRFAMIGVEDRFGDSGQPWELMKAFGLTAEYIAQKVIDLHS